MKATTMISCNITNFLSYLFVSFYGDRKERIIMITWSPIRKMQHGVAFLTGQKESGEFGKEQETFLQPCSLKLIGIFHCFV